MTDLSPSVTTPIGPPGPGDRFSPRNPLGIIALFVFLIEAIATVSLKFVVKTPFVKHLVWFIILYPTFIALAFFVFLWKKREAFYSPYDFRSDTTFQDLLKNVEVLKIKQDAAQIDESTHVDDALLTVDRLIALGDVRSAIEVGRVYLKQADYERSIEVSDHLLKRVPQSHELYYKIRANRAYALIGSGRFDEAIAELDRVRQMNGGSNFMAWHGVALAYAHFRKGDTKQYEQALKYARELDGFRYNVVFFSKLYPEIRDELRRRPQ
jgi:tetratricopeptide (TPR) repeat protein